MGDLPSTSPANTVRTSHVRTNNITLEEARSRGLLDTGGGGRSVTVTERADAPRPRDRTYSTGENWRLDGFFRRFSSHDDFVAAYPALEDIDPSVLDDAGAFTDAVEAVAARTGDRSYTRLLMEFGPTALVTGLKELRKDVDRESPAERKADEKKGETARIGGDMPSVDNLASTNRVATANPQQPASEDATPTTDERFVSEYERSVMVASEAKDRWPWSRHVINTNPDHKNVDAGKVSQFIATYKTFDAFCEAFPALGHIDLDQNLDAFTSTLEAIASSAGDKNLSQLLDRYDLATLLVALKELRHRVDPLKASSLRAAAESKLAEDEFAASGIKDSYNPDNLSDYDAEVGELRTRLYKTNGRLGEWMDTQFTRDPKTMSWEMTTFAPLLRRFVGSPRFVGGNETYAAYFGRLFQGEATARFMLACIERFGDRQDVEPIEIQRLATFVGEKTFKEIFLSQLRTEAAAPDFRARPGFGRIMIVGLKTLYETRDAEKALTALRAEAKKCWPHLSLRGADDYSGNRSPVEKDANSALTFSGESNRTFHYFENLQPTAFRHLIEDMIYYHFITYGIDKTRPGVVADSVFDLASRAPLG